MCITEIFLGFLLEIRYNEVKRIGIEYQNGKEDR